MSAPLRSLAAILAVWVGARAMMLLPGAEEAMAPAPAPVRALLGVDAPVVPAAPAIAPRPVASLGIRPPAVRASPAPDRRVVATLTDAPPLRAWLRNTDELPAGAHLLLASFLSPKQRPDLAHPLAMPVMVRSAGPGRPLQGDAYIFVRDGDATALAPGAQLGGGQAFARISRPIGGGVAATARASRALQGPGGEGAVGLAWRPREALPLGITVERRAALDAGGRDAWAAFMAGGADAVALAPAVRLDAYAQAGMVGARRRDAFVDGAARIGRSVGRASIGGGAWGAAQPGAARLDVGPQAALRVRLGDVAATAALDWRFRVAGRARPGNGLALTLAAGF